MSKPTWTCLQVSHLPNDVEERIWRDENGRLHVRWNDKDPWEENRRLLEALGPFAELGAYHRGLPGDVKHLASVPVEWLRRAAKAMEPQTTKPKD